MSHITKPIRALSVSFVIIIAVLLQRACKHWFIYSTFLYMISTLVHCGILIPTWCSISAQRRCWHHSQVPRTGRKKKQIWMYRRRMVIMMVYERRTVYAHVFKDHGASTANQVYCSPRPCAVVSRVQIHTHWSFPAYQVQWQFICTLCCAILK